MNNDIYLPTTNNLTLCHPEAALAAEGSPHIENNDAAPRRSHKIPVDARISAETAQVAHDDTHIKNRTSIRTSTFFLSWALFLAAGCTVGPNYHRPPVATAPAWKEQPPWRTATPQDSIPKGAWWTIFGDTELNDYETRAIGANQTIEAARNQLEQARASARITASGLFPQATVGFSAQRSRLSGNLPNNGSTIVLAPVTQNAFSL
ncbi:MAG TPA: hypothetical protein VJA94_16740, partial [Candidatus Angelobacter sp.]